MAQVPADTAGANRAAVANLEPMVARAAMATPRTIRSLRTLAVVPKNRPMAAEAEGTAARRTMSMALLAARNPTAGIIRRTNQVEAMVLVAMIMGEGTAPAVTTMKEDMALAAMTMKGVTGHVAMMTREVMEEGIARVVATTMKGVTEVAGTDHVARKVEVDTSHRTARARSARLMVVAERTVTAAEATNAVTTTTTNVPADTSTMGAAIETTAMTTRKAVAATTPSTRLNVSGQAYVRHETETDKQSVNVELYSCLK
ncbi:hypothetical protein FS749_005389 [Ceratobasidium sp. UAMH 11750]|nr:hypothetical protein FS749_005389 [Ceratobasidium sp. UAMH 11750]